jgi:quercetin dioxygenase-like cupin family protein
MRPHVIEAGQGTDYDWSQDHISVKTPAALTDGRVTVVGDVLKPGFHLPAHRHLSMVEIFFIIEGDVSLTMRRSSRRPGPPSPFQPTRDTR